MNPDRLVPDEGGTYRPECFGHNGYGDGYAHPGKCHPRGCDHAPACYAMLRERVEHEHALEWEGYEAERQRLREQGLDSNQIVVALAGKGQPPPTQDAYLANVRQGQLDSGRWHACAEPSCDRVILRSYGEFCGIHKPKEETPDGEQPEHGPSPAESVRPHFGPASGPFPPLQSQLQRATQARGAGTGRGRPRPRP